MKLIDFQLNMNEFFSFKNYFFISNKFSRKLNLKIRCSTSIFKEFYSIFFAYVYIK